MEKVPDLSHNRLPLVRKLRRDDRRELERKAAAVELSGLLYGAGAILGPTPAGPDRCPPWCPYCSRLRDFEGLDVA